MASKSRSGPPALTGVWGVMAVATAVLVVGGVRAPAGLFHTHKPGCGCGRAPRPLVGEGNWMWVREPEQERRVTAGIYNRYCVRCHGVDGRGVWDVPDVPNFVDTCWQDSRSDDYIAQILDLGRGACMPAFRGT